MPLLRRGETITIAPHHTAQRDRDREGKTSMLLFKLKMEKLENAVPTVWYVAAPRIEDALGAAVWGPLSQQGRVVSVESLGPVLIWKEETRTKERITR